MHLNASPACIVRAAAAAGLALALAAPAGLALADASSSASAPSGEASAAIVAPAAPTAATLSEDELDTVVGSYTYQGVSHDITARQAIEDSTSLESVKNDDGTYTAPTADTIVSYARNQILAVLVDEAGVEVSDEELASYAERTTGVSDIATIATYYQMDEDQARRILTDAAAVFKLRDQVVGSIGDAPQAPAAPDSDADASAATEDYAAYITGLLGSHWDTESGAWADEDNVYYQSLQQYSFDGKTATYEAAQVAYYVAYNLYQQQASQQRVAWTQYVDTYLAQATISIATLRS